MPLASTRATRRRCQNSLAEMKLEPATGCGTGATACLANASRRVNQYLKQPLEHRGMPVTERRVGLLAADHRIVGKLKDNRAERGDPKLSRTRKRPGIPSDGLCQQPRSHPLWQHPQHPLRDARNAVRKNVVGCPHPCFPCKRSRPFGQQPSHRPMYLGNRSFGNQPIGPNIFSHASGKEHRVPQRPPAVLLQNRRKLQQSIWPDLACGRAQCTRSPSGMRNSAICSVPPPQAVTLVALRSSARSLPCARSAS